MIAEIADRLLQMPVYKESLRGVIMPTVNSLKTAISRYELCGGTASIFVNDDGLQACPKFTSPPFFVANSLLASR